jgi:hypothetical protein
MGGTAGGVALSGRCVPGSSVARCVPGSPVARYVPRFSGCAVCPRFSGGRLLDFLCHLISAESGLVRRGYPLEFGGIDLFDSGYKIADVARVCGDQESAVRYDSPSQRRRHVIVRELGGTV